MSCIVRILLQEAIRTHQAVAQVNQHLLPSRLLVQVLKDRTLLIQGPQELVQVHMVATHGEVVSESHQVAVVPAVVVPVVVVLAAVVLVVTLVVEVAVFPAAAVPQEAVVLEVADPHFQAVVAMVVVILDPVVVVAGPLVQAAAAMEATTQDPVVVVEVVCPLRLRRPLLQVVVPLHRPQYPTRNPSQ